MNVTVTFLFAVYEMPLMERVGDGRTLEGNYIAPELRYGMFNAVSTNQRK